MNSNKRSRGSIFPLNSLRPHGGGPSKGQAHFSAFVLTGTVMLSEKAKETTSAFVYPSFLRNPTKQKVRD